MSRLVSLFTLSCLAAACGGSGSTDAETAATGEARYADAETKPDGSAREPARPTGEISVTIEVRGSGDLSGLEPTCLDGAAGMFEGLLATTTEVDDDGVYFAGIAEGEASFETPSGCEIPELEIAALSEVVVRGELSATAASCESYCSARARQSAESECAGSSDQVACRSSAEGDYMASCQVACEQSAVVIAAETELSAAARAELAASQIAGSSLGTLDVNLVFDRIEDGDGAVIDEE